MTAPLPLGRVVATPGVLKLLMESGGHPSEYLTRHATGDWGERDSSRVLSSYPVGMQRVWIITEADRSVTTILLPEEY
jgi:hypothetical protein